MRRLILVAIVALLLLDIPAAAAAGDQSGAGVGGEIVDGAPEAVVVVGRSGTVGSWESPAHGGARWRCGYYAFELDPLDSDGGLATVHYDDGPVDPDAGEAYVLACYDASDRLVRSLLQVFDPADPLGGIAATERALDEARRRLDLPEPRPALNPPAAQLVGLPTWLWVDGPWEPASATASVGAVAATVTATPVEVEWDTGDGSTTTCDAGTAYDPARPPADQASDCTHTFTRSSSALPDGTYPVTATVTYDVSWTASTGAGGGLGALSRSTTVAVPVVEAQALIR